MSGSLTWVGAVGDGDWENAANWDANAVPTANDAVTVSSATAISSDVYVFLADAFAASLTFSGAASLTIQNNTLTLGTLTETSGATVTYNVNGGAISVTGDFSGANDTINAFGGNFIVAGTATLNGVTYGDNFVASYGDTIAFGAIAGATNAQNYFTVNDTSLIELGGTSGAPAGQFLLDSGQTLAGSGAVQAASIVVNGTLEARAGVEDLYGPISGSGALQIASDGTLQLHGAVDTKATPSLGFISGIDGKTTGRLALTSDVYDVTTSFAPLISGFFAGDSIDLAGLHGDVGVATVNSTSAAIGVAPGNGVTYVTVSGYDPIGSLVSAYTLTFEGHFGQNDFHVQSDGNLIGGTLLTTSVTCFLPGTLIRTPGGEMAVEDLRPGDLVVTSAGEVKPVAWIGVRTVASRFADPARCWPIRVRAGALGENVPARDLRLSPDHALLVGGVLVHAGALVNGVTVLRETEVPERFTYYHLELDDHSLILAENTPAETFVDTVERMAFDNWAEHEALWPTGKPVSEMEYPRAKSARQLPGAVRKLIAARAKALRETEIAA